MPACVLTRLGSILLCATPWTVARQAPLSMGILQVRILEWVDKPSCFLICFFWYRLVSPWHVGRDTSVLDTGVAQPSCAVLAHGRYSRNILDVVWLE